MPAMIISEDVIIASDGGCRFDGYFARPTAGAGPGILIFSEMWGVAAKKRDLADTYARQGWWALAPNMFWRSEFTGVVPFDEADLAWNRLQAFDWERSVADCRTAVTWLRHQPGCAGKIAAIGFCMGGRIAFLAASRAGIDAAVGLYALGIAKHLDEVRKVAVPVQLHYGLSDEHISSAEIAVVAAAAAENRNVEVQLYPGAGHGFFNRIFSLADEQAVTAAGAHIERFLAKFERT
jgi:carboxymethylenebutenolidase